MRGQKRCKHHVHIWLTFLTLYLLQLITILIMKPLLSTQESGEPDEEPTYRAAHAAHTPRQQPDLPSPCFPESPSRTKPNYLLHRPSIRADFNSSQKQDYTQSRSQPVDSFRGDATSSAALNVAKVTENTALKTNDGEMM